MRENRFLPRVAGIRASSLSSMRGRRRGRRPDGPPDIHNPSAEPGDERSWAPVWAILVAAFPWVRTEWDRPFRLSVEHGWISPALGGSPAREVLGGGTNMETLREVAEVELTRIEGGCLPALI